MPQRNTQHRQLIEAVRIDADQPRARGRYSQKQLLKILLGLLALSLVFLLWFVISARSVIIAISPAPDNISLTEGWPALKLQHRYLAQPGEYRLTASRQGYYPLNESLTVGRLPSYTFKRTLQKKPGRVSIALQTPERARVYINNRYVGVAPMQDLALKPGAHSIELQRYRYQPLRSQLQVEGGEVRQQFSFTLSPDWSLVSLDSRPSNAQVWLNDQRYGDTPLALELDAGVHRLAIVHADYAAHISDFVVLPDQPLDLGVIELERDASYLVIRSQPDAASVYIDGRPRGTTPLTIRATPNADYSLRFDKPGYRRLSRHVSVSAGERKSVAVVLKPILSSVHLDITPKTAQVTVDGKPQAKGSQTLSLTATSHTIEVKESGYQTYTFTLTPSADRPIHKKITLQLKQSARAPFPPQTSNSQGQTLRLITPGEFVMGASRREQGRRANERLRRVKLTRRFYIGVNEITNEEFARFDARHNSGVYQGVNLAADRLPVTNISWQQAAQYCNWLSRKEDLPVTYRQKDGRLVAQERLLTGYRLVTEAEWAWVARVRADGSLQRYGWGDEYPPGMLNGNYADESSRRIIGLVIANSDDGFASPAPVGSFAANRHGLYDIDANVAEWMHDYYTIYAGNGAQVSVDPAGPAQGKHHVVRGASWLRGALSNTRLAYRDYRQKPRADIGFRIARYIDEGNTDKF